MTRWAVDGEDYGGNEVVYAMSRLEYGPGAGVLPGWSSSMKLEGLRVNEL